MVVRAHVPIILGLYSLGDGERDAILLTYRTDLNGAWLVMDDYLGYLVSDRLSVKKLFLLDLIPRLVTQGDLDRALAAEIVEATRPRCAPAFVEHSLLLLKEGLEVSDGHSESGIEAKSETTRGKTISGRADQP